MTIYQADCVAWANAYDGEPFHALLCDAPYEMEFMGKSWDGSGVAFKPETWQALARVLYDGAFLFVCAGTLNDDLISVAMREAGLVKFHKMIYWTYGSGFPKATRLDTQIDEAAGAEREEGVKINGGGRMAGNGDYKSGDYGKGWNGVSITAPATPLARTWAGHRYGGQALKPACETILIFRKPYAGKPVECITRTGAGALWIDGARIGTHHTYKSTGVVGAGRERSINLIDRGDGKTPDGRNLKRALDRQAGYRENSFETTVNGRWPANFVLTHHPDCVRVGTRKVRGTKEREEKTGDSVISKMGGFGIEGGRPVGFITKGYADANGMETIAQWRCVDGCTVKALGEQSGELSSGKMLPNHRRNKSESWFTGNAINETHGDTGTAARFFYNADWAYETAERIANADAVRYTAKAGRKERDAGLDAMPMNDLWNGNAKQINGSGDPAKQIQGRNFHPTVKPISLMKHLATLLLPPVAYAPRRILVPFAGVASEMIGAYLAGWEEITGIELQPEYCAIGEARLRWWTMQPANVLESMPSDDAEDETDDLKQTSLF